MLTTAPGNGAPIGGLKVVAANGWFAARPSGTEDVYKIYAESFRGADHLRDIQGEPSGSWPRPSHRPVPGSEHAQGTAMPRRVAGMTRRHGRELTWGSPPAARRGPMRWCCSA